MLEKQKKKGGWAINFFSPEDNF